MTTAAAATRARTQRALPNLFKTLLPLTTMVDNLLAPEKDPEGLADDKQHFYFGGIHCTVWMKLYICMAVLLCLIFTENIIQDAALIKARFIDSGQKFLGIQDLFAVWEEDSLSFRCIWLGAMMLSTSAIYALVMTFETPFPMALLQVSNLFLIRRLLLSMIASYVENVTTALDIYSSMNANLARLSRYRTPSVWVSPYRTSLQLPQEYDPLFKNLVLLAGIMFILWAEYFVERVMLFYSYENFLDKINQPFEMAYRRWQFKRRMARRRAHHRARLARRHQNVNANYTYAQGNDFNWSMHTAVEAGGEDNGSESNWSMRTAVGKDKDSDEAAGRAKDREKIAKLGPKNPKVEERLNKTL